MLLPLGTADRGTNEERAMQKIGEALNRVDPARIIAMDLMHVSVEGGEKHAVKSIAMRPASEKQLQFWCHSW